jgi:hypothetical protein
MSIISGKQKGLSTALFMNLTRFSFVEKYVILLIIILSAKQGIIKPCSSIRLEGVETSIL